MLADRLLVDCALLDGMQANTNGGTGRDGVNLGTHGEIGRRLETTLYDESDASGEDEKEWRRIAMVESCENDSCHAGLLTCKADRQSSGN